MPQQRPAQPAGILRGPLGESGGVIGPNWFRSNRLVYFRRTRRAAELTGEQVIGDARTCPQRACAPSAGRKVECPLINR
jgi:hypothetical protein